MENGIHIVLQLARIGLNLNPDIGEVLYTLLQICCNGIIAGQELAIFCAHRAFWGRFVRPFKNHCVDEKQSIFPTVLTVAAVLVFKIADVSD
ncbi:MAG: hypothetical protein ACOYOO_06960 [Saprospiraceae bacterium]